MIIYKRNKTWGTEFMRYKIIKPYHKIYGIYTKGGAIHDQQNI